MAGARAILRTEHAPPVRPVSQLDRIRVKTRDRLLARFICVSQQTCKEHLDYLGRDPGKAAVVYNGIDFQRFSPDISSAGVREEFTIPARAPIVGTVTRLSEERKGGAYFVEMAARIAQQQPDARFLLVGDGDLQPRFERQAHDLGVADKLILAGRRRDVPRLLAAMTVFVLPSLWEACQYSLLEAMAMARPVVSTPVGVAPEVVLDGLTGRLAPVADSEALSQAVLDLLSDEVKARAMGMRGRERIVPDFSVDAMLQNLVNIYSDVV
jgi:glycosyltransferase involved in cell wall biosynthesis